MQRLHTSLTKRVLVVSFPATVLFSVVMMLVLLPQFLAISGGLLPLDLRITYTPNEANTLFSALGEEGIAIYHSIQLFDMGFPIALAITLSSTIALTYSSLRPAESKLPLTAFVPFFTAAFDYAENILVWTQLDAYPSTSSQVLLLAGTMSSIKVVLLVISVSLALLCAIRYLITTARM
ncbi:MAG: hypothetical protein GF309_08870 [Candidatus Lokiarchaeota archaeon]|nr:hypothetical protein [Candidatus Lokiarchaeota archaeon]